ncbi:MAG: fibrinogen-like YCDxxxxGGGW domain-containing protein [Myxococcota bacterium]|nr:fibrinogen-like YCDxxxxGGGW domain-containing protein [Myxococcota bacterium]
MRFLPLLLLIFALPACSEVPSNFLRVGEPTEDQQQVPDGTGGCESPWSVLGSSCREVLAGGESLGDGYYLLRSSGTAPFAVYCDMTDQGGGWTLASVHADDGTATWTMDNRSLFGTSSEERGTPCDLQRDYRSAGAYALPFDDLLFRHQPSGTFARYDGVPEALMPSAASFGALLDSLTYPGCGDGIVGVEMAEGSLLSGGNLCSTKVYFHPGDHEDGLAQCLDLERDFNHATYGPAWSLSSNAPCPLDDPAAAGIGPVNTGADGTWEEETIEYASVGWGAALQLNTGIPGSGENRMELLIR